MGNKKKKQFSCQVNKPLESVSTKWKVYVINLPAQTARQVANVKERTKFLQDGNKFQQMFTVAKTRKVCNTSKLEKHKKKSLNHNEVLLAGYSFVKFFS